MSAVATIYALATATALVLAPRVGIRQASACWAAIVTLVVPLLEWGNETAYWSVRSVGLLAALFLAAWLLSNKRIPDGSLPARGGAARALLAGLVLLLLLAVGRWLNLAGLCWAWLTDSDIWGRVVLLSALVWHCYGWSQLWSVLCSGWQPLRDVPNQ
jgi:hypothetical protein